MEDNFESGPFCKAILTGLFAGIVASVSSLVYNVLFMYYSGFPFSTIINVSTIIFGLNIVVVIAGLLYFYLKNAFRGGTAVFIGLFLLLTLFCLWKTTGVQRSENVNYSIQFRELLSGIIIITGFSCFFLIPFLFNNKAFNKHVV